MCKCRRLLIATGNDLSFSNAHLVIQETDKLAFMSVEEAEEEQEESRVKLCSCSVGFFQL